MSDLQAIADRDEPAGQRAALTPVPSRRHRPAPQPATCKKEERTTMEPRLNLLGNTVMTKFVKYLVSAS